MEWYQGTRKTYQDTIFLAGKIFGWCAKVISKKGITDGGWMKCLNDMMFVACIET